MLKGVIMAMPLVQLIFLLCLTGCWFGSFAVEYNGKLISSDWNGPIHSLAGAVYAVDEARLMIVGFTYDGVAPDSHFRLGKLPYSAVKGNASDPASVVIANDRGTDERLGPYNNQTIILRLPSGTKISDFSHITVWCRQFNVVFGAVNFPPEFQAPAPQNIGTLSQKAHGVRSGDVTIIDSRTILIRDLYYDGQGPDTFWYIGNSQNVELQTAPPYGKIPDENGGAEKLPAYSGQNVTLHLPDGVTALDIKWLSIFCITFKANFGDIFLPANLSVPPYLARETYNGKLISSDWNDPIHSLAGTVYAVNDNTLRIIGFTYDGVAPVSFFRLGKLPYRDVRKNASDPSSVVILNDKGTNETLGAYKNQDIILKLPQGSMISDFTYISVWCQRVNAVFGGVTFPSDFRSPKSQNIGQFTQRAHGLKSGNVTVVDSRTFFITDLYYDGQGPKAFWYIGNTANVTRQTVNPYGAIPDENGSTNKLPAYSNQNITLRLPSGVTVYDIKWLSIYCLEFEVNFGEVIIPSGLTVPPYIDITGTDEMNCESLDESLQVSWAISGDVITFELSGYIDRTAASYQYMAFGLSGSETTFQMIGADVVVTDWKEGSMPRAIDYRLTDYSQCANNGGACPDTKVGGTNDVIGSSVTATIQDGITRIKFSRKLKTGDSKDQQYKTDGSAQQIVWGIGPLNVNGDAAKHTKRITASKTINFGRTAAQNCPAFVPKKAATLTPFKPHHLYGKDVKTFTMEIGQAGNEQGYFALTGKPSWGIAWYVNGILIPELHLKRNETYTFRVGGGSDPSNGAKYHPLYFTDSLYGGHAQASANDTEKIFTGIFEGMVSEKAVGRFCEWKLTGPAIEGINKGKTYADFEQFKGDMTLECDDGNVTYGEFKWTPDSNTPDLVYYQCYTHKNLGWKVHVYDQYPAQSHQMSAATRAAAVITTIAMVIMTAAI